MKSYFVKMASLTMILVLFVSTGICDDVYSNNNGGVLKVLAGDAVDPALDTHVKSFKVRQADGVIRSYDIENLRLTNPSISSVLHQLPSNGETTVPTVEVYDVQLVNGSATYTLDGGAFTQRRITLSYNTYSIGSCTIKVTATSGSDTASEEFTIYFSDGKIEATDIQRGGRSLTGFRTDQMDYTDSIDALDDVPNYDVMTSRETAVVTKTQNDVGEETIVTISISETDNDGNTINEKIYRITVTRLKTSYLNDIMIDGVSLAGFDKSVTNYDVSIPYASTSLPTVSVVKGDPSQTISKVQASNSSYTAIMGVVTTDGRLRGYTVNFVRETNDSDATLKKLTMDGRFESAFEPFKKEYTYEIQEVNFDFMFQNTFYSGETNNGGATVVGSRATFVRQINGDQLGTAVVRVTAVDGTVAEYTIKITVKATVPLPSNDATLSIIRVNGVDVPGFTSDNLDYTVRITHEEAVGVMVTAETTDRGASITMMIQPVFTSDDEESKLTRITVMAEDGTVKIYSVNVIKESRFPSQDSALLDVKADGVTLQGFSPTVLNYTKELPLDTTVVPTLTFTQSDANATVVTNIGDFDVKEDGRKEAIVSLVVTAVDTTFTTTYTVTFIVNPSPPSSDATLSTIKVNGIEVQGFRPDKLSYLVRITHEEAASIRVEAEKNHPKATIDGILQPFFIEESEERQQSVINVMAEDGTPMTYSIHIVKEARVLSQDSALTDIKSDGVTLPGFVPTKVNYTVQLPWDTTVVPTLTYSASDVRATVDFNQGRLQLKEDGGKEAVATLIVTADDPAYTTTYTVNFIVDPRPLSTDANLAFLKIAGVDLESFDTNQLTYSETLPFNTTVLPNIQAISRDAGANVVVNQTPITVNPDGSKGASASIIVTAESTTVTKTYQIDFTILAPPLGKDATLGNISLNGKRIDSFVVGEFNFSVTIPHEKVVEDMVTVETTDTKATVSFTQPDFTSTERETKVVNIVVTAEDGLVEETYILTIIKEAKVLSQDSTLTNISIDGVAVAGFNANQLIITKELPYGTTLIPTVTYIKGHSLATVVKNRGSFSTKDDGIKQAITTLTVTAEDASFTTTYEVYFIIKPLPLSDDATLVSIKVGGIPLENFSPTKYSYEKSLPVETTTPPVITYITSHPGATVEENVPDFIQKADKSLETVARLKVTSEDVKVTTSYVLTLTVPKSTKTEPIQPKNPEEPMVPEEPVKITVPTQPTIPVDNSSEASSKDNSQITLTVRQKEELIDKDMEGYLKDVGQKGIDTRSSRVAKAVIKDIIHAIEYTNQKDIEQEDTRPVEDDSKTKVIIDTIKNLEHPISKLKDDQDIINYTEKILQEVNIYQDAHAIKEDTTKLELALSSVDLAKRAIKTVATKKLSGSEVNRVKRRVGITITDGDLVEIKDKKNQGIKRLKDEVNAIFQGQEYQLENVPVVIQAPKLSQQIIGVDVTVNKKTLVNSDKVLVRTDFCSFTLGESVFDESLEDITISQTKSQLKPKKLEDIEIIDTPVMDFVATKGEKTIRAFEEPLTTSFKLDKDVYDQYNEEQLESLTVFYYNEKTKEWEPVGGKFDPVTQTITTELPHFSQYTVMLSNKSFSDVNQHWARKEINIMLRKGIIDGSSDFSPNQRISRAEFSSWVSKAFRIESITGELPFKDVKVDHPYYQQIFAAFKKEIIKGKTETLFDADGFISREEIAALVTRALARYKEVPISDNIGEILSTFIDKEDIAMWAESGVATAIAEKLIYGYPNKSYRPQKNTQKDEAAVLIYNIYYR